MKSSYCGRGRIGVSTAYSQWYLLASEKLTLEEIGDKFGLTRERVRQIKEETIRRLRNNPKNKLLRVYLGQ